MKFVPFLIYWRMTVGAGQAALPPFVRFVRTETDAADVLNGTCAFSYVNFSRKKKYEGGLEAG